MEDIYYMRNPLCPYKTIEKRILKKFTPISPSGGLCPAGCLVCFADMCEGSETFINTVPPKELKYAKNRIFINETCESTIPGKESIIAKYYQKLPKKTNILDLETRFPCSTLELIKHFNYHAFDDFIVQVSFTGFNEKFRKIFEPGTDPTYVKLKCIKQLIDRGVNVSVRLDPLYPNYHTKKRLNFIIKSLSDIGVKRVTIATLKLTVKALRRIKKICPPLAKYYNDSKLFHREYYLDSKIRKEIIGHCLEHCTKFGIKAALCLEYKKDHKKSCGLKPSSFCEGLHLDYPMKINKK